MSKIIVKCDNCEAQVERYISRLTKKTFCTPKCRVSYNTTLINCYFCGNEKRILKSSFNPLGNHFCNRNCKDEWQREGLKGSANPFYGRAHTANTRRKISESKEGNFLGKDAANYNSFEVNCAQCGEKTTKIQYLIDRSKHLFCSVKCHGKWKSINLRGENSPTWNPNLTDEERQRGRKYPKYYEFISSVMKRDNYTCDICDKYSKWGNGLNVHHLNSYDWDKKNRTNTNNGITLCKECHVEFHKTYGFGKNTKEQYFEHKENIRQVNTVVTS